MTLTLQPIITKYGFRMLKLAPGLTQYQEFHQRVRKALGIQPGTGMSVNRNCPPGCVGTVVATARSGGTTRKHNLKIVCTLPGFPHYSAGINDRSLEMNQLIAEDRMTPEARGLLPLRGVRS